MTFHLSRSRSSTASSTGFPELSPSLLNPTDALAPGPHAGRRLSKMRHKLSCTLLGPSHSSYAISSASHTQTMPVSRPKLRRAISRSMIAPLQHLFGGDGHQGHSDSDPERLEHDGPALSPTLPLPLSKHCSTLFSRRLGHGHGHHRAATEVDEWDFRCAGLAPTIPKRPSQDALSPMSAYDHFYDHSLLGSPLYPEASFGPSSASSCCSSPEPRFLSMGNLLDDGTAPKKHKVSVDCISAPIALWAGNPTRPSSPLPGPPCVPHRVSPNQLGLELKI